MEYLSPNQTLKIRIQLVVFEYICFIYTDLSTHNEIKVKKIEKATECDYKTSTIYPQTICDVIGVSSDTHYCLR